MSRKNAEVAAALRTQAASYTDLAETYRMVAESFPPGSQGYAANLSEAAKYAQLAVRSTQAAERAEGRA